jgi:hypothetical protein
MLLRIALAKRLMEVQAMKMISQWMILGGKAFKSAAHATDKYHAQFAGGHSGPGTQSFPKQYDQFGDLESVLVMEERYGIKEEGLF